MQGQILDIDIGNTRVKWRIGGQSYASLRSESWIEEIKASVGGIPARVRVANVGGPDAADKLDSLVSGLWGLKAEYAKTSATAAGVQCCYDDPSRLGIDRWLVLLAAWSREQGKIVVIDAGSALTVDAVDGQGRQQGGFIVPGLDMQRRALFAGTSQVQVHADWTEASPELGVDTLSAVQNGAMTVAVGLVEYVASRLMPGAAVYITGGDARLIAPHLSFSAAVETDLVLDGLAVLLP